MRIKNITLIGFSLLVLSSCRMWSVLEVNASDVISKERYEKMVQGQFTSVDDVIKLFPKNVTDIEKRVSLAIERAEKDLAAITSLKPEERTFANTARALDEAEVRFNAVGYPLWAVKSVSTEKDVRDACHESMIKMQQFSIDAFLNVAIYKAFKEYIEGNAKRENLFAERQYFLDESMKGFRRAGLHLPADELAKVKALQKELGELSLEFSRNVATDKSFIAVTKEELSGTDDHFIKNLDQDDDGNYIVRCDYPSRAEVAKHCSVASTRRAFHRAFSNRAYPANKQVLETMFAKRDALAKLLGYESYAAYDLDAEMAKEPKRAEAFLKDLIRRVEKKAEKEFERVTADLPEGVSLIDGRLQPWDYGYVVQQYKKKHFNVDDREIAEYFPMEKTIEGIFSIYQKFLSLDFRFVKPDGLWHEDASVIEVRRLGSDNIEGYLFLDLHPRDDKYTHACFGDLMPPVKARNGLPEVPSVGIIIANFPKSTPDRPSLLKHSDVTTFFHEFGHAMHGLLGRTDMPSFAGTSVKRDFVEVPSQMFEEWMWDPQMLKDVTGHYKTGAPLPDELISKMIELKRLVSGDRVQSQSNASLLSLAFHAEGAQKDVEGIVKKCHDKYIKNTVFDPESHGYAAWGHIASSGYASKYYSYLWAEVFSQDVFETIRKHGLLNPEIGQKLISTLLGVGGSAEPDVLLRNFLGREPNQDAFLKDVGVEV